MVSVVLVTYNRAERLRLSIQDILDQTYQDLELLICDDNSNDDTEQLCKQFAAVDKRIKYFRHSQNKGMPGNLNYGIYKASSEYVAILHDGDRFHPALIQKWYSAMISHPSVGFIFNSIGETDENDKLLHYYREFKGGIIRRENLLHYVFFRRWRFDSPVYGEVMVRKSLIEDHGYFKPRFGFYSDVDMWMTLLHEYDAYYVEDTLITGPVKSVQPRLFDDKLLKTFFYMQDMHAYHRKIEFRNTRKLFSEMLRFHFYSLKGFVYILLLILKNNSYGYYFDSTKIIIQREPFYLLPWFLFLLLSPFIKIIKLIKKI